MRAESGPELRAVPDDPEFSSTPIERSPAKPVGKRPWLSVILLLALGIAALGYGVERSRANALESQVVVLEAELQSTRQHLEAYERRLGAVRVHVADLAERIGLLQEVVSEPTE